MRVNKKIQTEELRAVNVISQIIEDENLDKELRTSVGNQEITSNVRYQFLLTIIDSKIA